VTVADYRQFEGNGDRRAIAKFVFERFMERYINPLNSIPPDKKNGFSIMALCCLMIEALESFRFGYEDTIGKSKDCFQAFFQRASQFADFNEVSSDFYKSIRCGILHQAETTGGWRITRRENSPLFDKGTLTINATKFLDRLKLYLLDYKKELETSDWDCEIWVNLKKKMSAIIRNCERGANNAE
jgi:hypothetical protein